MILCPNVKNRVFCKERGRNIMVMSGPEIFKFLLVCYSGNLSQSK